MRSGAYLMMQAKPFSAKWWRSLPRETLLLLLIVPLIVLFLITGEVVGALEGKQNQLAVRWFARGQSELAAGKAQDAVQAFRTALLYRPADTGYERNLAHALASAGRVDEARSYLLTLWERRPGSADLNLELARLAVRSNQVPDAMEYFHNAIYGGWEKDAEAQRRQTRLEFARFLIDQGKTEDARNQLSALAAEAGDDMGLRVEIGELLLRAGEAPRALDQFRRVLVRTPMNQAALIGAGKAAFEQGDYALAERYLTRAVLLQRDPQAVELLQEAREAISLDPLARGIGEAERDRRAIMVFETAQNETEACLAKQPSVASPQRNDLEALESRAAVLQPTVNMRQLRGDADRLNAVVKLSFDMVQAAASNCGQLHGRAEAVLLIARRSSGQEL